MRGEKNEKNYNSKAKVEYLKTITRHQTIYHSVRNDIQLWGPKKSPVALSKEKPVAPDKEKPLPASSRHLEECEVYCEYLIVHMLPTLI